MLCVRFSIAALVAGAGGVIFSIDVYDSPLTPGGAGFKFAKL
jgi:hypothetical protein